MTRVLNRVDKWPNKSNGPGNGPAKERRTQAEQGALTIEAGGGGTGIFLKAPHADAPRTQLGTAFNARLSLRCASRNWLEVTLGGFFEPPVRYFHNGVTMVTDDGRFPGTLSHDVHRYGVLAGVRLVHGSGA